MATSNLSLQNYFATSLAAPVSTSDTTIYLNVLPTGSEGYLEIDEGSSSKEIIYYTSKGSNFVTCPNVGTGRGVGGTNVSAHLTGATVKMKIDAEYWLALQNGSAFKSTALSPVNMVNPYKFYVYRNSAWTVAAPGAIPCDTKVFDTGTNVDVATNKGRFTAPVNGFYFFNAGSTVSSAGGTFQSAYIYKNGSVAIQGTAGIQGTTGGFQVSFTASGILQLTAGDYVEGYFYGSGAVAGGTGATTTFFQGFLMSTT